MMGWDDKLKNKKDEAKGAAKENLGKATDDEQMEREGQSDQSEQPQAGWQEGQGRLQQGLWVRSPSTLRQCAPAAMDARSWHTGRDRVCLRRS
jgi:uncharacterized protein YjbJ (UPF0337 family)